jgi:hypothetical protein
VAIGIDVTNVQIKIKNVCKRVCNEFFNKRLQTLIKNVRQVWPNYRPAYGVSGLSIGYKLGCGS